MIPDRKAWTQRLITQDQDLADFLKSLHSEFQAKVMKLEHAEPDLCWNDQESWVSEQGVVPTEILLAKKKT